MSSFRHNYPILDISVWFQKFVSYLKLGIFFHVMRFDQWRMRIPDVLDKAMLRERE